MGGSNQIKWGDVENNIKFWGFFFFFFPCTHNASALCSRAELVQIQQQPLMPLAKATDHT